MCTCTSLPQVDLDGYYETLNFDVEKIKEGESPSIKDIQKAYRKACLKCHPDKFPHDKFPEKAEMFDKVQEAFEILLRCSSTPPTPPGISSSSSFSSSSYVSPTISTGLPSLFLLHLQSPAAIFSCKEQEEEDKLYTVTEYEVTIEKGPRGVGLGLVVAQDPKSGAIAVTKVRLRVLLVTWYAMNLSLYAVSARGQVTDGIKIVVQKGEARPNIYLQDVLVGIGDDRIVGWPIARGEVNCV